VGAPSALSGGELRYEASDLQNLPHHHGLSGIVGQVILLRELLISFYGNEITLGSSLPIG